MDSWGKITEEAAEPAKDFPMLTLRQFGFLLFQSSNRHKHLVHASVSVSSISITNTYSYRPLDITLMFPVVTQCSSSKPLAVCLSCPKLQQKGEDPQSRETSLSLYNHSGAIKPAGNTSKQQIPKYAGQQSLQWQ